jgi:Protein-L-isoaspartate(D-aspartate) O-methyltransferase (PCMT)
MTPITSMRQAAASATLATTLAILAGCVNTSSTTPATLSKERIAEIIASPDRRDADRTNDLRRHPADMLAFIGIRPGMVALDVVAGGGYTTELLARSVGPTGRVYGQRAPRNPTPPATPLATPEGNSHPNLATPAAPPPAPAATPAPRPTSAQLLAERAKSAGLDNIVAVVQK